MTTTAELREWCVGAEEEFGDASIPVCQIFFHWVESLLEHKGEDLVAGMLRSEVYLLFGAGVPPLALTLVNSGHAEGYSARRVTRGVYQIEPSLNLPGIIHGFVVLYEVPEPAPWERRVIVL